MAEICPTSLDTGDEEASFGVSGENHLLLGDEVSVGGVALDGGGDHGRAIRIASFVAEHGGRDFSRSV